MKRSGGHRILGLNCIGHHRVCFRWSHRWLVVKDSFLLYMSRNNTAIDFVLLFDSEFDVKVGRAHTGTEYGVCIENYTRYFLFVCPDLAVFLLVLAHSLALDWFLFFFTRNLIIKCISYRQSQWWSHEINRMANSCDFLQKDHRFEGFVPMREDTLTKWSEP